MDALLAAAKEPTRWDFTSNTMVFSYIVVAILIAVAIAVLLLRRTVRTRLSCEARIAADPDINEWLVVFSWTNKILYLPTILLSLVAAVLMFVKENTGMLEGLAPAWIGAVWIFLFLINYMVEEYEINLKVAIIGVLAVGFFMLLLNLIGQVAPFLRWFTHIRIEMSGWAYLAVAIVGLVTIGVSWYKGLFYYVALTPNYMNLQWGPTESGEQIKRDQYRTTVDTSDFMERLFGFGRIIITFLDQRRPPITLLVWRISNKAPRVESLSGTFSIDADGRHRSVAPSAPPVGPTQNEDGTGG